MIKFLGSKTGSLAALVLALIAQLPHSAEVFMQAGNAQKLTGLWYWAGLVHGTAYAVALEIAVLVFVVRGLRRASYLFAGVSVLINLCYYAEQGNLQTFGAWIISLALPAAIALYSHGMADEDVHKGEAAQFSIRAWWATVQAPWQKDAQPETIELVRAPVHSETENAQIDKRALAAQLHNKGMKIGQIAEQLDLHRNTISNWLNNAQLQKG